MCVRERETIRDRAIECVGKFERENHRGRERERTRGRERRHAQVRVSQTATHTHTHKVGREGGRERKEYVPAILKD